jgi:hypothetical protein
MSRQMTVLICGDSWTHNFLLISILATHKSCRGVGGPRNPRCFPPSYLHCKESSAVVPSCAHWKLWLQFCHQLRIAPYLHKNVASFDGIPCLQEYLPFGTTLEILYPVVKPYKLAQLKTPSVQWDPGMHVFGKKIVSLVSESPEKKQIPPSLCETNPCQSPALSH